jgi:hypothetical protein
MPLAGIGVREHPEMLAEFFGIHGDGARGPGPCTRSPCLPDLPDGSLVAV